MKIKICIMDNDAISAKTLDSLLKKWGEENHVLINSSIFNSKNALLHFGFHDYDAIFMDITLKDTSGIKLAKMLRQQGYQGELIFLTIHKEYVFEGYYVHALNFLVKPARYADINYCLQYIKHKLSDNFYYFHSKQNYTRIAYQEILYFSSQNQCIEIFTPDFNFLERRSLKSLFSSLPPHFLQCHRTCIVNTGHIIKIAEKELILSNGISLPISNTYFPVIKHFFFRCTNKNLN